MIIAIANDHSGVELKNIIMQHLADQGHQVINLGTDTNVSTDYPIYGKKLGDCVKSGECELGIAVCGTGLGISLAANKIKGIRAAVCTDTYMARMARAHNNANILALGARVIGPDVALDIVDTFLATEFEGGRHERRLNMIRDIEENS